MAKLREIVEFLDTELNTGEIPDYPGAHNGLQLENRGEVTKVASAVDASLPVIEKAIAAGADLLVVHHGLFWQGVRRFTGAQYLKYRIAIESGLAIYSSHIPLDVHEKFGNNILLCEALGLGGGHPFHDWKGIKLGRQVTFDGKLGDLRSKLCDIVGGPVMLRGHEESLAGEVGIITGGAGSEVEAIAGEGINTFITGEGPHWSHPLAEELGINLLFAGHYATETFGVRAIGNRLGSLFGLSAVFVDHPTGL